MASEARENEQSLRVCVPKMSSTSCDLRVFMEDAAEAITTPELELI
jgi:hypothetical protein